MADLRGISWHAPGIAVELGTLFFGTVCGFHCWILTDERHLCAEARRMDGKPFPAVGDLGERKAHTIRGSVKSWPVGLAVRRFVPADFRALLVVEGGPDYLAALHFTLAAQSDCLPVAFLGAGTAAVIHAEALALQNDRPLTSCFARASMQREQSQKARSQIQGSQDARHAGGGKVSPGDEQAHGRATAKAHGARDGDDLRRAGKC